MKPNNQKEFVYFSLVNGRHHKGEVGPARNLLGQFLSMRTEVDKENKTSSNEIQDPFKVFNILEVNINDNTSYYRNYYGLSPSYSFDEGSLNFMMKNSNLFLSEDQGLILENLVNSLFKNEINYLEFQTTILFYDPEEKNLSRNVPRKRYINATKFRYLEFDIILKSSKTITIDKDTTGFAKFKIDKEKIYNNLIKKLQVSNYVIPGVEVDMPIIISDGELVIIEVKKNFNVMKFMAFLNKVHGLMSYWSDYYKNQVIHILFFYDTLMDQVPEEAMEFILFMTEKNAIFSNYKAMEYIKKEFLIDPELKNKKFKSFELYFKKTIDDLRQMVQEKKGIIEVIYFDGMGLALKEVKKSFAQYDQIKKEMDSLQEKVDTQANEMAVLRANQANEMADLRANQANEIAALNKRIDDLLRQLQP